MATYYVDPVSGSNSNGGTSVGDAWETIAYAFTQTFSTHDILLLLDTGTHTVSSSLTIIDELYIRGANSSGAVDGSMATIDFTGTGGLFTSTSSVGLFLKYVEVYRSTGTRAEYAVILGDVVTIAVTFEYCKFHNFDRLLYSNEISGYFGGMMFECELYDLNYVFYQTPNRGSPEFHYCDIHDIYIRFGEDGQLNYLNHCVFWNMTNGDDYIKDDQYSLLAWAHFCTFYGVGYQIGDRVASDLNLSIYGCVFVNAPEYGILWDSSNLSYPYAFDYNLFYNNTSGDTGNMPSSVTMGPNCITGQDPLFVDAANGDLTPGPNSPLIGAGPGGMPIGARQPTTLKQIVVS